ncbi:hypothetical protein AbraIFM66951_004949 [Aspergillus brasiliensis]|uniref:Rhodopsin domain-containing protein n=1 Tax=Aspergillus brasiliensis TaxID=319629 RepID=A0A9W5YS13_9EURO|nr:hypothetical protein AbraCBS73388_009005 [Aspergillus brasiliensis]GKZ43583.1 hypothetical protein AbraIFM66951_004949 [Aspergillus brasiliensis]
MNMIQWLPHVHYALHTRNLDTRAHYPATQDAPDHVAEIAIATIYLMVIMILAVLIRLAFRLHILRSLQWDDATASIALVFAVAQCAVIIVGTENGLGKQKSSLNDIEVQALEKFAFWVAIAPIDIITELVICILPIYIVKPVQVVFGKKVTVVVAFFIRIFVIISTIVRLIFMRHSHPYPSTDMNDATFATIITTECVLCVSVMTACIPCLKPFLDAFDSGMLSVSLSKRIGGGSNSNLYGNTYALTTMTKGVKESVTRSRYLEDEVEGLGTSAAAFAVTSPGQPLGRRDSTLVIQRTDQWSVRCEYVDPKDGSLGDETEGSVPRGEHSL